jgi:hypothetical protein
VVICNQYVNHAASSLSFRCLTLNRGAQKHSRAFVEGTFDSKRVCEKAFRKD